jgi:NAD-dependent deacetylase
VTATGPGIVTDDPPFLPPALLAQAVEALARARHVCVLTGAGISAESGIPTFRDALTGLWADFRAEDLATPEAFERDPAFVWQWYEWRREQIRQALPNAGHRSLAELARIVPRLTLVTQNVDGLHQRAGSPSVVEYHGNILRDRCVGERKIAERSRAPGGDLPRCASCGGLLRPDVVWFGEAIPGDALLEAEAAARGCDAFLSIGTSSLVYPAAGLAETALRRRVPVIEVNPNPTDLTPFADVVLQGPSGRVLPALHAALPSPRPAHGA